MLCIHIAESELLQRYSISHGAGSVLQRYEISKSIFQTGKVDILVKVIEWHACLCIGHVDNEQEMEILNRKNTERLTILKMVMV